MSYLDEVATAIKEHVPAEVLPDTDTQELFRLYAVLALAKGRDVSAADVHNAWAAWMQERNPAHRSIQPYSALDAATQRSDDHFVSAIRRVAEELA